MQRSYQKTISKFEEIEREKADILSRVDGWSPERLEFRPSEREWSALEVFDHLVRTEVEIQAAAREGLASPHAVTIADRVQTRFLTAVFKSERRVKIPVGTNSVLPGVGLSMLMIRERWDSSRAELADFLKGISEAALGDGIFRHPVGGWMNILGVLGFFSVHITHHQYQLNRISASSMANRALQPST